MTSIGRLLEQLLGCHYFELVNNGTTFRKTQQQSKAMITKQIKYKKGLRQCAKLQDLGGRHYYHCCFLLFFRKRTAYKYFIETVRLSLDITEDRSVDYAFGNLHFRPCVIPYIPAW